MDWLYTIALVLFIVWLATFLLHIGGKLIHLILVIALIFFLGRFFGLF